MDKLKILKAGKIASEIKKWIRPQIRKGTPLLEIAEKIESKIIEFGGRPAFPTNLSINEIAAHYTPSYDDKTLAFGLLKIDFGVCVDGFLSDTAFSLDLEDSDENKELINASEKALKNVIKIIRENTSTREIGIKVQETIESFGFSSVINLSGHEMTEYDLHAGLTIPNVSKGSEEILEKGLYAIEPFATNGSGKVRDGKDSGIYVLIDDKNIRNSDARNILKFIIKEYQTLPFCSRWLVKEFGTKALFALRQLEQNGNLHNFAQLVENSGAKVSQTEQTVLIDEDEVIITTD
jgi:methionyl aminopeptidase